MMTFPRYDSYKDSGVEWLGEIPSHWDCRRLKHIAKVRLSNVDKHSRANELPVKLCNYTDVYYQSFITNEVNFMEATATEEQIYNFSLEKGDVLITKDSESFDDIAVSAYVPKTLKNVICGYHLAHIKPTHIEGSYLFRAFQAEGISSQFRVSANGITRFGIGKSAINDAVFLLPPIAEQKRIVEFLDRFTAEIDRAISQKQRLIELLQEQKAILINQAVTKGLNLNVPMRDSAIEWIGDIPQHWEVTRIGFLANLLQTGPFGSQLHQEEYIEGGIPVINPSQMLNGVINPDYAISVSEKTAIRLSRHRLIRGDIVFARRGEMGRCGLVCNQEVGWLCGTGSLLFRPKREMIDPKFAIIVLGTPSIKAALEFISVGATMDNLNTAILSKISLPIPPMKEQSEIISRVGNIEAEFSSLERHALQQIDLLHEFRQVVIASAVTGKIKV